MFVAPMDAEGVKLISRASYEMVAGATGSPYDYPLSSRFDENDAILVMDKVLIPWENVLIYRDFDRCRRWTMEGGFARMYPLQACVRPAVKLDFITALLKRSLNVPAPSNSVACRPWRSGGVAQHVLGVKRFHVLGSDAVGQRRMAAGSCRAADLSRDGADGLRQDQEHHRA